MPACWSAALHELLIPHSHVNRVIQEVASVFKVRRGRELLPRILATYPWRHIAMNKPFAQSHGHVLMRVRRVVCFWEFQLLGQAKSRTRQRNFEGLCCLQNRPLRLRGLVFCRVGGKATGSAYSTIGAEASLTPSIKDIPDTFTKHTSRLRSTHAARRHLKPRAEALVCH